MDLYVYVDNILVLGDDVVIRWSISESSTFSFGIMKN